MSKGAHASAACMHLHAFGLCHAGNKAPSMFAQREETRRVTPEARERIHKIIAGKSTGFLSAPQAR